MNALTVAVSSPLQPQHYLDCEPESFALESRALTAFVSRVAQVDRLIDRKTSYIMASARLRALTELSAEQGDRCHSLLCILEENIGRLQEQIDWELRELKGLFYAL